MQIKSYNKGEYFSISSNGVTSYYNALGQIVTGNVISSLSQDNFTIGCVTISYNCNDIDVDCPPNSLNTNAGFCILSNAGIPLMAI